MNSEKSGFISFAALVLSIAALVMGFLGCRQQRAVVDVEAVLEKKPEIVAKALSTYEAQQQAIAEKRAAEARAKFNAEIKSAKDAAVANPEGSVVLVEFFDYSCGFCHRIYPALKVIAEKNPNVKIVAKPLSFLGPNSVYAARASFAAGEQGKFAEMYHGLFGVEGSLEPAKVDEVAANIGLDMDAYKAAMESASVDRKMEDVQILGRDMQVGGVPTFFLNGEAFGAGSAEDIQLKIDSAAK